MNFFRSISYLERTTLYDPYPKGIFEDFSCCNAEIKFQIRYQKPLKVFKIFLDKFCNLIFLTQQKENYEDLEIKRNE